MDDTNIPQKRTTDEKLDEIVQILEQMNRRDRTRMIGSTIRSILGIIPLVIFLWSVWYFTQHGAQMIQDITEKTVKSTMGIGVESNGADPSTLQQLLDQLQGVQVR